MLRGTPPPAPAPRQDDELHADAEGGDPIPGDELHAHAEDDGEVGALPVGELNAHMGNNDEVAALPAAAAEEAADIADVRGKLVDVYQLMDELAARVDPQARRECAKLCRDQVRLLELYDRLAAEATGHRLALSAALAEPTPMPARLATHPAEFVR